MMLSTNDLRRKCREGVERTEDDVGTIQPGSDDGCDEELRAIGVLSGVRHRQQTGLAVLELEVLICVREQG